MARIPEFGLGAAIVLAVGGFGGTEPISWGIAQTLILLLGLLLVANPRSRSSVPARKLFWIPVVLVAWVAIQWLSSSSGRIGSDSHAIKVQGLALTSSIVAFYVALEVARERGSRMRLALYLIGLGLFEAVYGLVQYLAGWQYIWNFPRRFYTGSATGTYINHNHFAGFLEMIFPLTLGLAFYHAQKGWPRSHRRSLRDFIGRLLHPGVLKSFLFLLVATVLFLATVFSLSRMGMISLLVSLGMMAAVVCAGRNRSLLSAVMILILLASGVATTMWVGVAPVVEHFGQLAQNELPAQAQAGRFALWKDTLNLIREHRWTGVGLGCFELAFTSVQSIDLTYVAGHAHNDYLELAAELGLPGAAFLFSVLFGLAGKTLRASLCARSDRGRALALGSFGGIVALLVHSIADFNLYIPANALVFAVLLGIGYATSLDESASDGDLPARHAGEVSMRRTIGTRSEGAREADEAEAGVSGSRSG